MKENTGRTANLGGIDSPRDDRDINLGRLQQDSYPSSYETDVSWLKTMWQDGYPMCGAFAGAVFKSILDYLDTGSPQDYSPIFLWKKIKTIDGFQPNLGTDGRSIMKVLYNFGVCDYVMLPIEYDRDLTEYSKDDTTYEQVDNASLKIIKAYGTENDIRKAIFNNKAVILLANVGQGWWGNDVVVDFTGSGDGHFFVAYGYDNTFIYIVDSADKECPFKKINIPIREVWTATDMPNWQVQLLKTKIKILKKVVELLIKLINKTNK
jgi:hypothetical protein